MMNQQLSMDLIPRNPKVASAISKHDMISNILPLPRLVKPLVDPPIEAEGSYADLAAQDEIVETLVESRQSTKLRIGSNLHALINSPHLRTLGQADHRDPNTNASLRVPRHRALPLVSDLRAVPSSPASTRSRVPCASAPCVHVETQL